MKMFVFISNVAVDSYDEHQLKQKHHPTCRASQVVNGHVTKMRGHHTMS